VFSASACCGVLIDIFVINIDGDKNVDVSPSALLAVAASV